VTDELVNVRYVVDDVEEPSPSTPPTSGSPCARTRHRAFAYVVRGNVRLLLSGPTSSAGRPMPDGRTPEPGGRNRIHLIVEDIATETERLRRGREVPQRDRQRAGRPADPGRLATDRAVPAGGRLRDPVRPERASRPKRFACG
jgi:hypothetical protein